MALIPVKKRKKMLAAPVAGPRTEVKFSDVVIFLVEWKMGTSRRAFLSQLARKKGFRVEDEYSDFVTHVVSENLSGNDVLNWLLKRSLDGGHKEEKGGGETRTLPAFLNISWFTESMSAGMPVEIESKHQLKVENVAKKEHEKHIATYACQRRTPLLNHNTVFTVKYHRVSQKSVLVAMREHNLREMQCDYNSNKYLHSQDSSEEVLKAQLQVAKTFLDGIRSSYSLDKFAKAVVQR
ncbi:DNA nucleotidylexotransferase-like [Protopterus annectens]|uniref:DNA nucleotidylexotransferase-like n=1 Tax=Protopterus annectens TaxID=7888 RepID=UPI001CFA5450|nr:DNA nucleotidylexotransferase-like [Protopterus annectens]